MAKMSTTRRTIYSSVGISGLFGLWFIIFGGTNFWSMSILQITAIMLLTIGGLNWGVVALTKNKDLLQLLNL